MRRGFETNLKHTFWFEHDTRPVDKFKLLALNANRHLGVVYMPFGGVKAALSVLGLYIIVG